MSAAQRNISHKSIAKATIAQAPGKYRVRAIDERGQIVGEAWADTRFRAEEAARQISGGVEPINVSFGRDV